MPVYDLTISITPKTTVFPGDPTFESKKLLDVNKGDPFTLCCFNFGNHMGTHIDFPSHLVKEGKCSSDYSLEYLTGEGKIVDILDETNVTVAHIKSSEIKRGDIVFFKTRNTRQDLHAREGFQSDFVSIDPAAAKLLVEIGVKIVGIDYLSVDSVDNAELPTHTILLEAGILIVENLNLKEIPSGEYFINISPLKVENSDGLPVRVSAFNFSFFADKELKRKAPVGKVESASPKAGAV
jgi:arylformamidase